VQAIEELVQERASGKPSSASLHRAQQAVQHTWRDYFLGGAYLLSGRVV